ncbi:MAG: S26 family signal peptidase [Lachnospiraceae bacterium]|nr:S26 family signal peptidase [Lachnospiraceae bacterium]
MQEKTNLEKLLRAGTPVGFYPQGTSMYPTIVPGRDNVIVEPLADTIPKRGDVLLFRRPDNAPVYPGKLILHRVWKVKNDGIYMVGDNEKMVEGPLPIECFIGIMTELNRKGKKINVTGLFYRILTKSWLFIRPIRFVVAKPLKIFKRK